MARNQYYKRMRLFLVFTILLLLLLCLALVMAFRTGEEATVGIFSLAATLVGTVFIAMELKNSQDVTCSDMLIDLNNYFHDSDRLMKVYEVLEECQMKGITDDSAWHEVRSVEIAQYCTFFENLYLLYRHHIASIEDLNDLFGYRFFLFMNNPYIQEHWILPTSSSYVQIFRLYEAWVGHRIAENENPEGWKRNIPGAEYMLSQDYLRRKLYLHECQLPVDRTVKVFSAKGKEFKMCRLGFEDVLDIVKLQERVVAALPSPDMYYPLSREELFESLHLDHLVGIYDDDHLVAMALLVSNRPGSRNLAADFGIPPADAITFDVVIVDPEARGYGFHRTCIDYAVNVARDLGAGNILATVDPANPHSLNNFLAKGFSIIDTRIKYAGLQRHLLRLTL
ncbi:MAG: GNAT family N-acetyltransferase [Muribaculaceae bacterium]